MKSLPDKPNLEFLKKEAKALRALHRSSDAACCRPIRDNDTSFKNFSDTEILQAKFSINDAQRIVAREYGFASWPTLKKHRLVNSCIQNKINKVGAAKDLWKQTLVARLFRAGE